MEQGWEDHGEDAADDDAKVIEENGSEEFEQGHGERHHNRHHVHEPHRRHHPYNQEPERTLSELDEDLVEDEEDKYSHVRHLMCGAGMILGFVFCFIELGDDRKINQTLAIAVWMATLWLTEVIPLVVTAFLPIILFPLFGILSSATVTAQYANNTIFLFISGFLMALTLQRWNLHRRFSLKILSWCGVNPGILVLGIMGATFILSMFVSNTATSLMMVPNALSICKALEESGTGSNTRESRRFSTAVMLGIAYSANVGGMASLIGTPPNLVFQKQLAAIFPDAPEMTFAVWLGFGFPIAFIMLLVIWGYLTFTYLRGLDMASRVDPEIFKTQYTNLGPWSYEQIAVTVLFTLEAFLWIFRKDLEFDAVTIEGWANIFSEPKHIADATVGMTIAVILFIAPGRSAYMAEDAPGYEKEETEEEKAKATKKEEVADDNAPASNEQGSQSSNHHHHHPRHHHPMTTLLDWRTANTMPYNIVFLFGGGFALAKGFVDSGLSAYLGEELKGLDSLSTAGIVFIVITLIIWLTELTSNTATSNIMIPITASLAIALETNPYTIMIPVTLACSCAFALPIATPPNMVVFSTGRLPLQEMKKAGLVLNIISSVVILGSAFTFIPWVTGEDADGFPDWAFTPST